MCDLLLFVYWKHSNVQTIWLCMDGVSIYSCVFDLFITHYELICNDHYHHDGYCVYRIAQ